MYSLRSILALINFYDLLNWMTLRVVKNFLCCLSHDEWVQASYNLDECASGSTNNPECYYLSGQRYTWGYADNQCLEWYRAVFVLKTSWWLEYHGSWPFCVYESCDLLWWMIFSYKCERLEKFSNLDISISGSRKKTLSWCVYHDSKLSNNRYFIPPNDPGVGDARASCKSSNFEKYQNGKSNIQRRKLKPSDRDLFR